jgi:hypothetical protein
METWFLDFRLPNILVKVQEPEGISSILAKNPTKFHPRSHEPQSSEPTFVSQPLPIPDNLLYGDSSVPSIILIDFGGGMCRLSHLINNANCPSFFLPQQIG